MNSKNKLIAISTEDLIPRGDGSYSCSISKLSTENVIAISLRTATLRNIFYNVISLGERKNNNFYYSLNGMDKIETIPAGFYSITELLAELSSRISITLASSGIIPLPTLDDFKYNSIQNKVEITINGNGTATPFELSGSVSIDSVNNLLGNWVDASLDTLTPTPYQFLNQINLGGLDAVHLISNEFASANGVNSNSGDVYPNGRISDLIAIIPLTAGFGGLVEYRARDIDAERITTILSNFSSVHLSLTDHRGRALFLDNSSLTLEFIAVINS